MNSKQLSGSILAGAGLLAAVVNDWAGHFFWATYQIARAESLEGSGSFDPGRYAMPETTQIFVGTRVLIWVLAVAGLGLLAWGVWEERERR